MKLIIVNLRKWIVLNFKTLFIVFAIGLLITGSLTQRDKYLVITKNAPKGILSWETNINNATRDLILNDWHQVYKNLLLFGKNDTPDKKKITGLDTVIQENNADYIFILFYVGFLLLYISRIKRCKTYNIKLNWLFIILTIFTIVGGFLDYIENLGTDKIVHIYMSGQYNQLPDAGIVGYPSRIKWSLLAVVVFVIAWQTIVLNLAILWLYKIIDFFYQGLKLVWRYRIQFISIFIVFAVLYVSDQGQDLLLSLNSEKAGVVLFLFSTSIIALLCWYLPRILDYNGQLKYREFFLKSVDFISDPVTKKRPEAEVFTSRLLGAAGFIVPAIGILKVMENYHMTYWLSGISPITILIITLIIYRVVLEHHWIDNFYKTKTGDINWLKYTLTLVLLIIPMLIWGTGDSDKPYNIIHLALDLYIFSIIFLITVTLRTCSKVIANWPVAPWITFTGLACLLFFIACNSQSFLSIFIYSSRFFTLPFVFFAVAGYVLLFSFVLFIGKKTGITWITIVLIVGFLGASSNITNYHGVSVMKNSFTLSNLDDSLTTYTKDWLLKREKEIKSYTTNSNRQYPVYFVNAHGGGIRATVWTTMVIGTLDSIMRSDTVKANKLGFQHYAFSYSGASGGTVGLMLLTASRFENRKEFSKDIALYPKESKKLYSTDNLTSDVIALLGRDLVYSSFGFSGIPDRARLMEMNWEKNSWDHNININNLVGYIWNDTAKDIPLLFSNTYEINSGKKGIIAPLLLDSMDFPSTIFVRQALHHGEDLRMSTAGFLSARFPYVSPTGKLENSMHFTDGGTIDNSGGETSLQVIKVFKRVRQQLINQGHEELNKISINILSLPNNVPGVESPVYNSEFYEPLGPPLGALHVGGANEAKAELINRYLQKTNGCTYVLFQPHDYKYAGKFWPVLPLGWQISDVALEDLQQNAIEGKSNLDNVLKNFGIRNRHK